MLPHFRTSLSSFPPVESEAQRVSPLPHELTDRHGSNQICREKRLGVGGGVAPHLYLCKEQTAPGEEEKKSGFFFSR